MGSSASRDAKKSQPRRWMSERDSQSSAEPPKLDMSEVWNALLSQCVAKFGRQLLDSNEGNVVFVVRQGTQIRQLYASKAILSARSYYLAERKCTLAIGR